jgi:tetratricopeptide (TPR) repeat protein
MSDYKKHFKTSHKVERRRMVNKIDGDVNISDLLAQANNLYINNRYEEAISVLHEIVSLSPELREPYHVLSLIYEERGDIPKALSFLMLAAQLSHGEGELWARCANLNKQIKNLQQAEYCLARAIKVQKNNHYWLYERASILEELGNLRKAAGIYEKLLKLSPNAELLLHISNLNEKLGSFDKSMVVIENNYEKNSRKLQVLIKLFDLYIKYEKYFRGYEMYLKLKNKFLEGNEGNIASNTIINYTGLFNNSHIKIRYLFCCLELSELKSQNILSDSMKNSNLTRMEKMILENGDEYSFKSKDHECNDSEENKIPEDLPSNSSIIDNIILEFGNLSTQVEMENNIELIHKLFNILQKANNIDKFLFMYEKLEKNFQSQGRDSRSNENDNVNLFSINMDLDLSNLDSKNVKSEITPNNQVKVESISNPIFHFQLSPEIYSKIGEHYLKCKNYQKAIDFFLRCLKNSSTTNQKSDSSDSDNVMIRFKLSEIYKLIGDYNSALEILNSDNFCITQYNESNCSDFNTGNSNIPVKKVNFLLDKEKLNHNQRVRNIEEDFLDRKNNPFDQQNEINRDFLQNQMINSDEEEQHVDNENFPEENFTVNNDVHNSFNNLNENKCNQNYRKSSNTFIFNNPFTHQSSNQNQFDAFELPRNVFPLPINQELSFKAANTRKNSYNFSEYNNIIDSSLLPEKSFLGKKRIRFKSNLTSYSIDNYNFETYLRRRNSVKSTDSCNTQAIMKTLQSLKFEYDELNSEINSCKHLYLKLQESLIYLQQNEKSKFLENTFNPLRQILIYELKIEDLKTQLFYHIVQKSSIKNYFKINDSIFGQFKYSNIKNFMDGEEGDYEDEENNENPASRKESLFLRKTENTKALARKKVRKTMELVEKQISLLQNIDKFISQENFIHIIISFVEEAYKDKRYHESINILQLILNSESFKQRNDYVLFNMHLYSILNNIQLNNHKTAFVLLKRLIVQFNLKDHSIFWIFLSKISSNMNLSHLRSFYYKLTYSVEMSENIFLNSLLGITYLQTGTYNLSLRHLDLLNGTKLNNDPMYYFQYGLTYLLKSLSRNNKCKESSILKANDYFNFYAMKRNRSDPCEVLFNMGRFYQFIGEDRMAKDSYHNLMNKINLKKDREDFYRSSVYNYALLYKKNGNEEEAHRLIMDNIIIE